jgi:hypothetical protein
MDQFRRTKNLVITTAFRNDILGAVDPGVGGAGAPLIAATAEVHLFTGATVPTEDSVAADFTEAALSTAAGVALANLTAAINLPLGQAGIKQQCEWIAGAAPTEETITGYMILDGPGGTLLGAERFEPGEECEIANEGDYVSIDVIPFALGTLVATGLN